MLSAQTSKLADLREKVKGLEALMASQKEANDKRLKEIAAKEALADSRVVEATRALENAERESIRIINEAKAEFSRAKSIREQADSDADAAKKEREMWEKRNTELKETFARIVR